MVELVTATWTRISSKTGNVTNDFCNLPSSQGPWNCDENILSKCPNLSLKYSFFFLFRLKEYYDHENNDTP